MTPLEINKRIAGIILSPQHKWWTEFTEESINSGFSKPIIKYKLNVAIDQKHIPIPNDTKSINWAENISDAWELFEEMEEPSVFKIDSNALKKEFSNLIYSASCKDLGLKSCSAETAPLAICKAWISWKEGQNK